MRATSRLVLVWTSISLVAVAVGWAALGSAIGTGNPEQVEVAALDPSVLAPSPLLASTAPTALPSAVTPSPRAAAKVVTRRRQPTSTPTPTLRPTAAPASPSNSPSPTPSEPPADDGHRSDPHDYPHEDVIRDVDTEGGSATIGYSNDQVYLLDHEPAPGHATQGDRRADDYIVVRFVSHSHSSTIHAFVDGEGALRIKVVEENY